MPRARTSHTSSKRGEGPTVTPPPVVLEGVMGLLQLHRPQELGEDLLDGQTRDDPSSHLVLLLLTTGEMLAEPGSRLRDALRSVAESNIFTASPSDIPVVVKIGLRSTRHDQASFLRILLPQEANSSGFCPESTRESTQAGF